MYLKILQGCHHKYMQYSKTTKVIQAKQTTNTLNELNLIIAYLFYDGNIYSKIRISPDIGCR